MVVSSFRNITCLHSACTPHAHLEGKTKPDPGVQRHWISDPQHCLKAIYLLKLFAGAEARPAAPELGAGAAGAAAHPRGGPRQLSPAAGAGVRPLPAGGHQQSGRHASAPQHGGRPRLYYDVCPCVPHWAGRYSDHLHLPLGQRTRPTGTFMHINTFIKYDVCFFEPFRARLTSKFAKSANTDQKNNFFKCFRYGYQKTQNLMPSSNPLKK